MGQSFWKWSGATHHHLFPPVVPLDGVVVAVAPAVAGKVGFLVKHQQPSVF